MLNLFQHLVYQCPESSSGSETLKRVQGDTADPFSGFSLNDLDIIEEFL